MTMMNIFTRGARTMPTEEEYHPILFVRNEKDEHVPVDNNPLWIAKLGQVIDRGESFADLIGPLLVRRGCEGDWHYYPAPFLFKSPEERRVAATRRGKNPPAEPWVRRKLALLYRLARREYKLVA
jgi:hypothetical protein